MSNAMRAFRLTGLGATGKMRVTRGASEDSVVGSVATAVTVGPPPPQNPPVSESGRAIRTPASNWPMVPDRWKLPAERRLAPPPSMVQRAIA
jgi:hypothetical protein